MLPSAMERERSTTFAVVVIEAADEVGEDSLRVAARGQGRLHDAVLLCEMNGDGGRGSLGSAARRPACGTTRPLRGEKRRSEVHRRRSMFRLVSGFGIGESNTVGGSVGGCRK